MAGKYAIRVTYRSILTAAALIALVAATATSASAEEPQLPEFSFDQTNLKVVESLDAHGDCLFRNGVYPAGGTGYKDSSLPYDQYGEQDAAFLTLRAELIRYHSDTVLGAIVSTSDKGERGITIRATSAFTSDTFDQAAQTSPMFASAVDTIRASGATIVVSSDASAAVDDVCSIQELVRYTTGPDGNQIESVVMANANSGKVEVTYTPEGAEAVRQAVEKFGDKIVLKETPALYLTGRTDDWSPWNGGNWTENDLSAGCTNAFRINTTGSLTADHCRGSQAYNNSDYIPSNSLGWYGQSLFGANVDAKIISGGSYSRLIWIGDAANPGVIPAYDIYPYYTIPTNGNLLISGAASYQASLLYNGSEGCLNLYPPGSNTPRYTCQLISGFASPNTCIGGDSGGPAAMYDPANGRVISLGIITGGNGWAWDHHDCYITNMMAVSYLYGGAKIG